MGMILVNNNPVCCPPWSDRRAHAAQMLASGISIKQVSLELGLSPATARRYQAAFISGGVGALLALGDVGRRCQLSPEALVIISNAVKEAPKSQGLVGDHWTNELIRYFIEREFCIRYSSSHVDRLIRDYGFRQCFFMDDPSKSAEKN
ncbi:MULTISPECIES: helix-turn-helix domain-containing protein [Burkholderiaceae]|uniref:Helix-turn-helix domain-containing protein n=1 Tax=Burkholderia cenocepacia TaxID=95486 RepID=A0ABD4UJ18_9BURK|nr:MULTISPECIES: helix-turn-helix domain-containing protein [Burkholderiaceae]MCW3698109.1 helix-turn-helix domain-containing protein [Burkholderia cenocepacia]MCW3705963.1 helix-turn-helix domain-containing protein [Burkholderia cenocepacia]MCW3714203.1 helix-turn-helix domain-containing protein [Burkholderia cenocepacia]MCW3722269.1 helix-turn-helix domain-containing protein [Burkholderia cenocepacia]MCW3730593.1 helix-turn-helix domain-containing protein [Burkholderia cenocepacia]